MAPTSPPPRRPCSIERLLQLIARAAAGMAVAILLCSTAASGTTTNEPGVPGSMMHTHPPEPAPNTTANYLHIQMEPEKGILPKTVVNLLDALTGIHTCSGVLLHKDMVATLASCVDNGTTEGARAFPVLVFGSNAVDGNTPGAEFARVCEQRIHNLYDGNPQNGHNIALLKLNASFEEFSTLESIAPAEACTGSMSSYGWPCAGGGRGFTQFGRVTPNLELVPGDQCRRLLGKLSQTEICTKLPMVASNPWDFGSPIFCSGHVVGLASHQIRNTTVHVGLASLMEWLVDRGAGQSLIQVSTHSDCQFFETKDEL